MPHCIIEYSKELEIEIEPQAIISAVYLGALDSALFERSDIKVRSLSYENHQTATEKTNFIHVSIRMLDGRNSEQKKALSHHVLDHLKQLGLVKISLTVEILDIERASYAKSVA